MEQRNAGRHGGSQGGEPAGRQGGREEAVLCCHLKFSFANSFAVVMSMLSSGLAPSPVSRMTSSSVSSLIMAAMRVASLDAMARVASHCCCDEQYWKLK